MSRLPCFGSYDIRARLGADLDPALCRRIGRAVVAVLRPGRVVLGRDIRASSPALARALAEGLLAAGADVIDIGLCGTEEVYFATDHLGAGAGLMVTASHNPIDYNGIKLVGAGAAPLSPEEFQAIHDLAAGPDLPDAARPGTWQQADPRPAYVARVLSFVDPVRLPPLRIVTNPGNGAAAPALEAIAAALAAAGAPLSYIRLHHDPDPAFPNGIPNPLLPENRPVTARAVRAHGADLGLAWDGDFDRCFFFDETGSFVAGEYVVGLLAAALLARHPGAAIVHDPRVIWNTQAVVAAAGGRAVVSRTGHALVKARMRETGAVYGGEMSAHHYFRDFMSCDSGMIPWVLVAAHMGATGQSLSALVDGMRQDFPSSGEINFRLSDPAAALARVEAALAPAARAVDRLDGLSLDMGAWRVNLRRSNTEPLVRLNLETRADPVLLRDRLAVLCDLIEAGTLGRSLP